MKVFAFLVTLVLFVGGLVLFGYAFDAPEPLHLAMFGGGILAVSAALALPFHLLGKTE